MPDHPTAPEQRTVDVDVQALDTRGRTVHGYAAIYGVESEDLGGFRERIAPGAFADVLDADVRCLLNHDANVVLGRTKSGTLRLADDQRGLRFEVDLPESRSDLREAVARGDLDGASFRFHVGDEDWDGDLRTVKTVKSLHDITLATYPAYPATSIELRTRPTEPRGEGAAPPTEAEMPETEGAGLQLEDRAATEQQPDIEDRVLDAIRSVPRGESRDLTRADADSLTPPDLSTFIWDRLRPASIALASGIRVVPTSREKITWPRITADVDPSWTAEAAVITAGDPVFADIEAEPQKLAHRVELSNEVIDDSSPAILDVLNAHLVTMLALKLDNGIFLGSGTPPTIQGLKTLAGIQTVDMGVNGAAFTDYDPFLEAIGLLQAANVPGPYAVAMAPRTLTELSLLKEDATSNLQLGRPADFPPVFVSSQLPVNETKGTATDASSAYVYAPSQVVLVRRADAQVELDRSRLFNSDQSEIRAKLRADLVVPNPQAIVRVNGIIPA